MILPESKTVLVEHSNKKVYDLGDKIAKVFNANKPASDVFNEALNLARISESGIRTPKPLEVSEVEGTGWALLTKKVSGVTLADKMAAEPSKFYEYLEQFVDLQVDDPRQPLPAAQPPARQVRPHDQRPSPHQRHHALQPHGASRWHEEGVPDLPWRLQSQQRYRR